MPKKTNRQFIPPCEFYQGQKINEIVLVEPFTHEGAHSLWWCKCPHESLDPRDPTANEFSAKEEELVFYGSYPYLDINNKLSCGRCKSKKSNPTAYLSPQKYRQIFRDAWLRGIKFDVSIYDLEKKFINQDMECALSGQQITLNYNSPKYGNASLDRINSSLGYTLDNIQWLHPDINILKLDWDEKYFIQMCKMIAKKSS